MYSLTRRAEVDSRASTSGAEYGADNHVTTAAALVACAMVALARSGLYGQMAW